MDGAPLAQARAVVTALVESLGEADRLEMIAFADQPRRWRRNPVAATASARTDARRWLDALQASGGTEMRAGIAEALRPLRADAQRQVVLVTDGQIGFEQEIVAAVARDLPPGSRLHTIGVGSSVNRSLTAPAARAGRGVEVVIGLDEEPAEAARQLVARTRAPLLTDLVVEGSALLGHAPARVPDLLAAGPALIGVRLRSKGGSLRVRGRTPAGAWEADVDVPALEAGKGSAAVVTLYGREAVEDLELRAACGERSVDAEIERLGLRFQIATRLTSWVAVSEEPAVDPTKPTRRERMPHELPAGMSVEGLGLRRGARMADSSARLQALPRPGSVSDSRSGRSTIPSSTRCRHPGGRAPRPLRGSCQPNRGLQHAAGWPAYPPPRPRVGRRNLPRSPGGLAARRCGGALG